MKTGWVIFETIQNGELTPGYQAITIYPELSETFESIFKAVCPTEYVYRGVLEKRDEAIGWVDNWRAA
jgi:hypothetical protein